MRIVCAADVAYEANERKGKVVEMTSVRQAFALFGSQKLCMPLKYVVSVQYCTDGSEPSLQRRSLVPGSSPSIHLHQDGVHLKPNHTLTTATICLLCSNGRSRIPASQSYTF